MSLTTPPSKRWPSALSRVDGSSNLSVRGFSRRCRFEHWRWMWASNANASNRALPLIDRPKKYRHLDRRGTAAPAAAHAGRAASRAARRTAGRSLQARRPMTSTRLICQYADADRIFVATRPSHVNFDHPVSRSSAPSRYPPGPLVGYVDGWGIRRRDRAVTGICVAGLPAAPTSTPGVSVHRPVPMSPGVGQLTNCRVTSVNVDRAAVVPLFGVPSTG